MGLLNKLKDIFFEEEIVEEETPKNDSKEKVTVAKKIETPEVVKVEEKEPESYRTREEKNSMNFDEELQVVEKPQFEHKFPKSFDDKDFEMEKTMELDNPVQSEEVVVEEEKDQDQETTIEDHYLEDDNYDEPEEQYAEPEISYREEYHEERVVESNPYHGRVEHKESHVPYEGKENKEKQGFTLSPIISPVWGVLDKNYKKEEIVSKKEIRLTQTSSKKADLDLVREKAYGDLAQDISASIEDNVFEKPKVEKPEPTKAEKEDLLYDLNEDESPTVKQVTVGDAEEYFHDLGLEYNVDYKVETEPPKEEVKVEAPKAEVKKEIEKKVSQEDDDDKNLFDLIDSMYEDKE